MRRFSAWGYIPAVLLWVGVYGIPLVWLMRLSFLDSAHGAGFYQPGTWTLTHYQQLLNDGYYRTIILTSLGYALCVTFGVLSIAYPFARLLSHWPPGRRRIAIVFVLLPKAASMFVVVLGLQVWLTRYGPINTSLLALGMISEPIGFMRTTFAVLLTEIYLLVPYAILLLLPPFEAIDPACLNAARGLGANAWQRFRHIEWPLTAPTFGRVAQLLAIWSLGMIVGPALMGGPSQATIAVEIQRQVIDRNEWPLAAALAMFTLALIAGVACWPRGRGN